MDYAGYIQNLEEAVVCLDRSTDKILAEATRLRDEYRRDSTNGGTSYAAYSFAVDKVDSSIRIRWGWFRPIKQEDNTYKTFLKWLSMNKQGTYHQSLFKKASARELSLIINCEQQLFLLRSELKKNRAIRQLISRRITECKKML